MSCSRLQANFATPPDGSRPRMRMYSWSGSQPYRDGDFEAGMYISLQASSWLGYLLTHYPLQCYPRGCSRTFLVGLIHGHVETDQPLITQGISTRLTGGPANSGCLGWGEAGGMGEGWVRPVYFLRNGLIHC